MHSRGKSISRSLKAQLPDQSGHNPRNSDDSSEIVTTHQNLAESCLQGVVTDRFLSMAATTFRRTMPCTPKRSSSRCGRTASGLPPDTSTPSCLPTYATAPLLTSEFEFLAGERQWLAEIGCENPLRISFRSQFQRHSKQVRSHWIVTLHCHHFKQPIHSSGIARTVAACRWDCKTSGRSWFFPNLAVAQPCPIAEVASKITSL